MLIFKLNVNNLSDRQVIVDMMQAGGYTVELSQKSANILGQYSYIILTHVSAIFLVKFSNTFLD